MITFRMCQNIFSLRDPTTDITFKFRLIPESTCFPHYLEYNI